MELVTMKKRIISDIAWYILIAVVILPFLFPLLWILSSSFKTQSQIIASPPVWAFTKLGTSVVLCGDIGAGNTTKLANQIIVALNIAAMSEALVLGVKAGVDPEVGGLAGSTVLDAKVPMVLNRNFKPGFKIDLHIKDLANAIETAREIGAPLLLTSQVMEILQALKVDGKGQNDHSAIVQFYEKLGKIEVCKK
jgi:2-hydroxy-3-oxopropionate reductase